MTNNQGLFAIMKWLWVSILVVIIDHVMKILASQYLHLHDPVAILPGLNLTLMHNTGAAFSFLSQAGGWQRWFFVALTAIVSMVIIVWLARLPSDKRWLACALVLILGGAIGNVWDRIVLGYVIDFVDVYYQDWHWPAFNVADSSICIGAIMVVIDTIWFAGEKEHV